MRDMKQTPSFLQRQEISLRKWGISRPRKERRKDVMLTIAQVIVCLGIVGLIFAVLGLGFHLPQ